MQFSKILAFAVVAIAPVFALPTANTGAVGSVELAGRSYLIVHAIEDGNSAPEKRGVNGDKLIAADGTAYRLVPESGVSRRTEIEDRSYLIVHAIEDDNSSLEARSYLIVHAIEDDKSAPEKRGVGSDRLVSEDGTTYTLVPVKK